MRRAGAFALAALAVAVALGFGAQRWWARALAAPSAPREAVLLEVARGASFASVARELEMRGVVRDARAFGWLARISGQDAALRAGEYELEPGLSAREVLSILATGRVRLHEVVIPEGLTIVETARRLAAAGLVDPEAFLKLARDPAVARELGVQGATLEGYLFPETYRLQRDLPPLTVAKTLVDEFVRAWAPLAPLARASRMEQRDAVVIASLVEKETGVAVERPLISAVFHNRLARHMRLETDPSVIYGIPNFDGNLRRVHLEDETNPYNTYRIPGLPPGPIASPGAASLRAAVEPADAQFLFFVARGDGTHYFSRTYEEHAAAVNRYQRKRQ